MATNSSQWPKDRLILRKAVGGVDIDVLSNFVNHVAQLTKSYKDNKGQYMPFRITLRRYVILVEDITVLQNARQDRWQ